MSCRLLSNLNSKPAGKRAADHQGGQAAKFKCSDQRLPRDDAQPIDDLNVAFTKDFEGIIGQVLDMYPDIARSAALTESEGGSGATFNQAACSAALGDNGSYDFKDTIWLHDLRWRAHPLTPINVRGIQELVESRYGKGPPENHSFTVTLASEGYDDDVASHAGKFKRVSPEEPVFAFLYGCTLARDADERAQYRRLMLTMSYRMLSKDNMSEIRKQSITIRENLSDDARAVRRTALSMLLLVVTQKAELVKALGLELFGFRGIGSKGYELWGLEFRVIVVRVFLSCRVTAGWWQVQRGEAL